MKATLARFGYGIGLLLVAGYALISLQGPRGMRALSVKQAQIRAMEKQNQDLAREVERLREHIKRLTDDNAEDQELEIRDRYKLVQPKDKVYVIGKPKSN